MKKRILIYAQQAGTAAILTPIIKCLKSCDYIVDIYAAHPAIHVLRKRFNNVQKWYSFPEYKYHILLAGYGDSNHPVNQKIFKNARRSRIRSIVLLDNWKGIDRFFDRNGDVTDNLPDLIAVMDDKTKDYLTQKGISEDRLVITGHPLIEYFASKRFTNKERIQVRKELKIPLNKKIIFIASEIIHYHSFYDACDTSIVKCCSLVDMNVKGIRLWKYLMEKYNTEDSVFIMRPHPNEKFKNLKKLHVVDWYKMDEITLLKSVDIMLGLTSMFVLLSVSAGVPTFNVEPLLNGWAPHNSFLRPELWKYLASHGFLGNWRNVQASIPLHNGATANVVKLIEENL